MFFKERLTICSILILDTGNQDNFRGGKYGKKYHHSETDKELQLVPMLAYKRICIIFQDSFCFKEGLGVPLSSLQVRPFQPLSNCGRIYKTLKGMFVGKT